MLTLCRRSCWLRWHRFCLVVDFGDMVSVKSMTMVTRWLRSQQLCQHGFHVVNYYFSTCPRSQQLCGHEIFDTIKLYFFVTFMARDTASFLCKNWQCGSGPTKSWTYVFIAPSNCHQCKGIARKKCAKITKSKNARVKSRLQLTIVKIRISFPKFFDADSDLSGQIRRIWIWFYSVVGQIFSLHWRLF